MAEAERKMHFAYSLTFFILFPPLSKSAEHLFPSSPIWVALSTRRHYYIEFALCVTFHRSAWNLAGTKKNVFHFLHEKSEHGAHFSWKSSSGQIEMKPSIFLAPKAHFRQEKKHLKSMLDSEKIYKSTCQFNHWQLHKPSRYTLCPTNHFQKLQIAFYFLTFILSCWPHNYCQTNW